MNEQKPLWKRVISAKYDQGGYGDNPNKSKYNSLKAPWRSIIKGMDWCLSHTCWKFNNGKYISFWNGSWTEKSPLSLYKPRLYALSNLQKGSVKDLWNPNTLDWDI